MDICVKATQMLEALLPDQKTDPNKRYRPSIYNHEMNSEDRMYIYNVLTRRLARITRQEAKLLQQKEIPGSDPDAAPLIAKRFLVSVDTDEAAHYVQLYSTQDMFLSAGDRGYTMYDILPTTGCNARCFYCFEQGMEIKNMSPETADAVAQFIIRTRDPDKDVELSWFGGEPMLRPAVIDRICAAMEKNGIPFYSTMITNGSLFTPELVEKAKNIWRLRKVQITLDGVEQEHNRRKAYVAFPDAYRVTLENIARLVKADIGVLVRMNMDPGNIESIWQLYEYLRTQYKPTDRISFDPAILSEGWFDWSAERTDRQQQDLRDHWLKLRAQMYKDGFYRPKKLQQMLPRWYCMANAPSSVTILPDGVLSMCQTGCEEMYYGDVWQGITKPDLVKCWTCCTNVREKCRTCPYLPECTGFAMCPSQQSDCRREKEDNLSLRLQRAIRELEIQ